jgi:plasmid stabilization system protein ParE
MTLPVRVLGRAQADADEIYLWLLKRSPAGAYNWYAALSHRLSQLADLAGNCSQAPEAKKLNIDLRQAFFKTPHGRNYRLLFVIEAGEVRVLRVRGPRQRLVSRRDLPREGDAE